MSDELESRNAEIAYLETFLNGRWIEIPSHTLSDLMETAKFDFSLDHDDAHLVHSDKISMSKIWSLDMITDAVMMFGCTLESLDMSISRLATAARYLGFTSLTPYAAAVCYSRFDSLKGEYLK